MRAKLLQYYIIIPLALLLSLILNCQKQGEEKEAEKSIERKVSTIISENKPQNPSLSLKFEENLSLTREGWWPGGITVDEEYNIYVYLSRENIILKFDSYGNEILKKEFPRGQGPNEYSSFVPRFSSDGKLFIYDQRQRRLTVMNENYEIINILKFKEYRWVFNIDSQGNMYFWVVKFLPGTKDVNRLVLSKFSPLGELIYEAFECTYSVYSVDGGKIEYKHPLFKPYGIYKLDNEDNLYFAMSNKYEINVISSKGTPIKKIEKKGKSRKATKNDIEYAMSVFPFASKPRNEIIIPSYMPHIADFFIFDNNYILILTFESEYDSDTLAGELFDENGIFQTYMEVPKYYRWYDLMGPIESNACLKNDYFYTIESDESEEHFYVKRYKMICE